MSSNNRYNTSNDWFGSEVMEEYARIIKESEKKEIKGHGKNGAKIYHTKK